MQQVNLLTPDMRPTRQQLDGVHLLWLCAGFASVLLLITGWQAFSLRSMEARFQADNGALNTRRNEIAAVQAQAEPPDALRAELARLMQEYEAQEQLANTIRGKPDVSGFADDLRALAQAQVPGLWLTDIRVLHGTQRHLSLHGKATAPVLIPRLLQKLAAQGHFQGRRFDRIELDAESDDAAVSFEIVSTEEGAAG